MSAPLTRPELQEELARIKMQTIVNNANSKVAKQDLQRTGTDMTQSIAHSQLSGVQAVKDVTGTVRSATKTGREGAELAGEIGLKAAKEAGEIGLKAAKIAGEIGITAARDIGDTSVKGSNEIAKIAFKNSGEMTSDSFGIATDLLKNIRGALSFIPDKIRKTNELQNRINYIKLHGVDISFQNSIRAEINVIYKNSENIIVELVKRLNQIINSKYINYKTRNNCNGTVYYSKLCDITKLYKVEDKRLEILSELLKLLQEFKSNIQTSKTEFYAQILGVTDIPTYNTFINSIYESENSAFKLVEKSKNEIFENYNKSIVELTTIIDGNQSSGGKRKSQKNHYHKSSNKTKKSKKTRTTKKRKTLRKKRT